MTAVIDRAGSWLPDRLGTVERVLVETCEGYGELLSSDAIGTLRAGGKRLRPLLVLVCGGEGGGEAAVRAASAIELVHMATLVHDDVLDAAPLRRGHPTVVATSGRQRATEVGDLLLSRAFGLLAEAGDADSVSVLSEASVALARGELAQRAGAYDLDLDERRYLERCRLKTAKLFESACMLGALAAGIPRESKQARKLISFGAGIGLAFQLLDDVLDVSGPPERTGKARGTDLLDGTVTLPLILARQTDAPDRHASEVLSGLDLRDLDPGKAEEVCDAVVSTGVLDVIRARGFDLVTGAKRDLDEAGLDENRRALLGLLADGVVQRYS